MSYGGRALKSDTARPLHRLPLHAHLHGEQGGSGSAMRTCMAPGGAWRQEAPVMQPAIPPPSVISP